MSFSRPPLATLRTQARADLVARFPTADAQLRRSLLNAIADVLAGMTWLLYGYLVWLAGQLLPDTAQGAYLERWLRIKGIVRTPAQATVVPATFAGIDGTPIPLGRAVQRGDGAIYLVTAGGTVASGTVTITLTAQVAGADGNVANGQTASLVAALAGINASGTFGGIVTEGIDEELDDSARARLLLALRTPAMGGSKDDFQKWTLAVAGVTRAWVIPGAAGSGTVAILFAVDDASYGPIPHSGDVAAVQAAIDVHEPVCGYATAYAPSANAVAFTIHALTILPGSVLATVKLNIAAALTDLFRQAGDPNGGTVQLQAISDAITRAGGVAGFGLVTPSADVTSSVGAIPTLGVITWT
jgi:uncharacterized phage protein gp47/JayE